MFKYGLLCVDDGTVSGLDVDVLDAFAVNMFDDVTFRHEESSQDMPFGKHPFSKHTHTRFSQNAYVIECCDPATTPDDR